MADNASTSRQKRWSLQGMTALVTGGTKGIGRAVVEELASFGAAVYTCSRTEKDLNECLTMWKEAGLHVAGSLCDVSSRSERQNLIEKVSMFGNGKLNILINNVGTNIRKPTVDYTAEDFSFMLSTNFESAYHLSQLAHPLLKASDSGSIVFISSVAGVVAIGSGTLYAATKGAMNQITKNFACEWAKDKIRVNCVTPWYTETPLVNKFLGRLPMQRITSRFSPKGLIFKRLDLNHLRLSFCKEESWNCNYGLGGTHFEGLACDLLFGSFCSSNQQGYCSHFRCLVLMYMDIYTLTFY